MDPSSSPAPRADARRPMNYRWLAILLGLAVVVSILLVYAENRVYEPATPFLGGTGDHFHTFALDPLHGQHFYLGTHYGFFRTTDAGSHWSRLNGVGGIPTDLIATSVSISPIDQQTIYATGYSLNSGNAAGLYVSHDDGTHWQLAPVGKTGQLPDPRLLFIAAGWAQPAEAYAYSIDAGLFRTLDRGAHWQAVTSPFTGQVTSFMPFLDCGAQSSAPSLTGTACPERFLVGTTQGLFIGDEQATDHSLLFAPVPAVTGYVYAVAVHHGAMPVVYASTQQGLFRATSLSGDFTLLASVANGTPTMTSLAVSGGDAGLVFAVTQANDVAVSHDSGQTWTKSGASLLARNLSQLSAGLRAATGNQTPQWAGGQNVFLTLVQAPVGNTRIVYAALSFPNQLFRSDDGGTLWNDLSSSG